MIKRRTKNTGKWWRGGKTARHPFALNCWCRRGVAKKGTKWMDTRSEQLKGMVLGV